MFVRFTLRFDEAHVRQHPIDGAWEEIEITSVGFLDHVIGRAHPHRLDDDAQFGRTGHHHHRGFLGRELLQYLNTRHTRQHVIEQNDIEVPRLAQLQAYFTFIRNRDLEAVTFKPAFGHAGDKGVIFDIQNPRIHLGVSLSETRSWREQR